MRRFLNYLFIFLTFYSNAALAIPTKHGQDNKVQIGRTDAGVKTIEALNGLGGSNPTIIADPVEDDWNLNKDLEVTGNIDATAVVTGGTGIVATTGNIDATVGNVTSGGSVDAGTTISSGGNADFDGDQLDIGDGTATDKNLNFDNGEGATAPKFKWNEALQRLQFCNEGDASCENFGSAAGNGGGAKSFVKGDDSDFEVTIGDWLTYDDGAVSEPVDGTGGSPTVISISRTVVAGEVLADTASLKIAKTAADGQGEGLSLSAIEIDNFQQGKELDVQFKYKTDANYVNNFYRVFIFDVTNANLLNVLTNGSDGSIPAFGGSGTTFTGRFTAAIDSTTYRLIVHSTSTDATAFDIFVDDIKVTEKGFVNVPVIGPWQTSTTTGNWTNTTYTTKFRQVGDSMEVYALAVINSPPAGGQFKFTIPDGKTIDINKVVSGSLSDHYSSAWLHDVSTVANRVNGSITFDTSTTISIFAGHDTLVNTSGIPFTWVSPDEIRMHFIVPIVEFNSGAILSTTQANDAVVKGSFKLSVAQEEIDTAITVVEFDTARIDSHNGFSSGNNDYTIPVPGDYFIYSNITPAGLGSGDRVTIRIRKNGSTIAAAEGGGSVTNMGPQVSFFGPLVEGDVIDITVDAVTDVDWDAGTNSEFSLFRISDFTIFGVTGTFEYLQASTTTDTDTVTLTTPVDITGLTLPLTPGTWFCGYDVDTRIDDNSGSSNTVTCKINITDSSNVEVAGTAAFNDVTLPANETHTQNSSRRALITVTSNETYKVRLESGDSSANGICRVHGVANISSAITDRDNDSNFWCDRRK